MGACLCPNPAEHSEASQFVRRVDFLCCSLYLGRHRMDHAPSSRLAMNKIFPLQLSFVGCCLLWGGLGSGPFSFSSFPGEGGEPIVSSDANASTDKPVQAPRSSQSETILRAAKDLDHLEVGRRVGAAKLLGKYPGSQSAFILVAALDDPSPLVRRSVMVSLAEHASNGYPLYDKSLVEKVYSKLGDTGAEVRREVSTMIPRLVSGLRRSGVEVVEINGRKIFSVRPAHRSGRSFANYSKSIS